MISAKPEIDFHIILATLQCVHATTFFRKGLDGNGSALHPPKSPNKLPHASQNECFTNFVQENLNKKEL